MAALTETFTVTSVNQAGVDRVNVVLTSMATQDVNGTASMFSNNLSLNLLTKDAEAGGYYPGKQFKVAITAA